MERDDLTVFGVESVAIKDIKLSENHRIDFLESQVANLTQKVSDLEREVLKLKRNQKSKRPNG